MGLNLLRYRPWQGELASSWNSPWPIARIGLRMMFRRKLFWILYIIALLNFMSFFTGIYLVTQMEDLASAGLGDRAFRQFSSLANFLKNRIYLAGTAATYRNFFWFQGYIVMAILALAGSVLVGNDYQHGSLPFYLSKPLGRWHYLAGKLLAIALFINMMTTFPALVLFLQCGLLAEGPYFTDRIDLLWGILGYGAVLTICLSLMVVATASWLRKTIPLIMVWAALLVFCRFLANVLVDGLWFDRHWRLIDMWNNLYILGSECLGTEPKLYRWQRGGQPEAWAAAAVVVMVCVVCLTYLNRRIRAVEIVA